MITTKRALRNLAGNRTRSRPNAGATQPQCSPPVDYRQTGKCASLIGVGDPRRGLNRRSRVGRPDLARAICGHVMTWRTLHLQPCWSGRHRASGCAILLAMAAWVRQILRNRRTAGFFGVVLCILLAFFAVERKIAAYPVHSVAAATIVATGVQKPQQLAFDELQSLDAPVAYVCVIMLFAAFSIQRAWDAARSRNASVFPGWATAPLAVRPPPTL